MRPPERPEFDAARLRSATEVAVRLAVVGLLLCWCFSIVRPFVMPFAMGVVLAVALYPVYARAEALLSGRRKPAAAIVVLVSIAVLLVPTVLLSDSVLHGARGISDRVESGSITIPPAPDRVSEWPLVGKPVSDLWNRAHANLGSVVEQIQPQIKALARKFASIAKEGAWAALVLVIALFIAGFLWVRREDTIGAARAVGRRIDTERGEAIVALAGATIRTVAKGVIGVAAIQAGLAAIGLVAAGVPAAGLWALLVLILAVAQLPPLFVLGPAIVYVAATNDGTATTVQFAV
jgi:predicted PurR-regulated permease PerM